MTEYEHAVLERAYNISQHIYTVQSRLELEQLKRVYLNRNNLVLIRQIYSELQRLKCIYNVLMLTLISKKQLP